MIEYLNLNYDEIEALDRKKTIFVSVMSPIEVHGNHLPVGTDIFIAREVMKRFVNSYPDYKFVKLPELSIGAQPLPSQGSIGVSYKIMYNLLLNFGKKLRNYGFKYWVIFDNHGGYSHQLAQIDAERKLRKKGFNLLVPFIDIFISMNNNDKKIGLDSLINGSIKDCHAGTNETSLMLATNEDLVSSKYKENDYYFPPKKTLSGNLLRILGSYNIGVGLDWVNDINNPNYIGSPRDANKENGEKMILFHVSKSMEVFEQLLNDNYRIKKLFNPIIRFLLRIIG